MSIWQLLIRLKKIDGWFLDQGAIRRIRTDQKRTILECPLTAVANEELPGRNYKTSHWNAAGQALNIGFPRDYVADAADADFLPDTDHAKVNALRTRLLRATKLKE